MISGRPRMLEQVIRGELTDGEVVVNAPGGDRALILNEMGDVVLSFCDGSRTAPEIAAEIRATLRVAADVDVTRDVGKILDQLLEAGVIESIR